MDELRDLTIEVTREEATQPEQEWWATRTATGARTVFRINDVERRMEYGGWIDATSDLRDHGDTLYAAAIFAVEGEPTAKNPATGLSAKTLKVVGLDCVDGATAEWIADWERRVSELPEAWAAAEERRRARRAA